jgi:hypothetical protein
MSKTSIVPAGGLENTFKVPDDIRIDIRNYVDLKVRSEDDLELLEYLSSEITPYSQFQSEAFVINSEVTDHRKIQQVSLEVRARMRGLQQAQYDIKKAEIKIKKFQRALAEETDDLERELLELEIQNVEYDIKMTKVVMEQSHIEMQTHLAILKKIAPENTLDVLKNYKENWEEKEKEYWTKRMGKQAMMDMLMTGKIQSGNLDSLIGMPEDARKAAIGYALLQTAKVEKGIAELADAVRNVLIENEKLEKPFELANVAEITGAFGGQTSEATETLKLGQQGIEAALKNPPAQTL